MKRTEASTVALVAVAALTVIAFALRLAGIEQSIYGDERLLYNIVVGKGIGDVLDVVANTEKTPPLHFLFTWGAVHLGEPTIWIRLPSLLFGTAAVALVYLLGLRTVGRWPGVVAAGLVALAPFSIFYGIENRAYATLIFFSALSTLTLLGALSRNRPLAWVAYGASTAAVLYVHYTGIFVVVAQLAWALYTFRDRARQLLLVQVGVALAFVPWLPSFLTQHENSADEAARLATRWALSVETIVGMFSHTLPGYPFVSLRELPGRGVVALVAGTIGIALAAAVLRLLRDLRARQFTAPAPTSVLIVLLALATPVGITLYSLPPDRSFLLSRNLSASVPALALLVAWLLTSLRPRFAVVAVGVVLGGVAVGAVKTLDDDLARPPYRQAANLIDDEARPGDAIVNFPTLKFSRSVLDPQYDLRIYFERPHDAFMYTQTTEAWARAGRGRSLFVVTPWKSGHMSRLGGPGSLFMLRDERIFPGQLKLAVGRYSGRVRAGVVTEDGRRIVRSSLGGDAEVSRDGTRGFVERLTPTDTALHIAGWAVDGDGRRPAEWVIAFSGGRLLAVVEPALPRADVARDYSRGALHSGFSVDAPTPTRYGRARLSRIRVFAVAGDRASELQAIGPAAEATATS